MNNIYYNEFNHESAAMIRQFMVDGLIPHGDVDTRSITEVKPDDLKGYTQCHFFAGIAGWTFALQMAGWPADRPVWTGSAPCQPFSSAGRQKGKSDERHLFPAWLHLIRECRPSTIFGEQVASAVTHGWLDDVYTGLEAEGYACGAAVLPACSVGAPHKRDRLWFVAHAQGQRGGSGLCQNGTVGHWDKPSNSSSPSHVADAGHQQHRGWDALRSSTEEHERPKGANGQSSKGGQSEAGQRSINDITNGSADAAFYGYVGHSQELRLQGIRTEDLPQRWKDAERHANVSGGAFWAGASWEGCADGKSRLVEPSIPLLAHGVQHRRPLLHAIGNAIVPQVAAEFIKSAM